MNWKTVAGIWDPVPFLPYLYWWQVATIVLVLAGAVVTGVVVCFAVSASQKARPGANPPTVLYPPKDGVPK